MYTHHEASGRRGRRRGRRSRVNFHVALLADRRVRRYRIPGCFKAVRSVRAGFKRRCIIAPHRGRLQGRRAERRGGARIIILPPTVNFAGDAQAMRIRIVRWYLKGAGK